MKLMIYLITLTAVCLVCMGWLMLIIQVKTPVTP